jgi:formylglycine-generating enzyme required for sulfatase activity
VRLPWPVGRLKPNDLGLFDHHGNVWNWCQDRSLAYPQAQGLKAIEDKEDTIIRVTEDQNRVLRGASFFDPVSNVRAAFRNRIIRPSNRFDSVGLRVARTYP